MQHSDYTSKRFDMYWNNYKYDSYILIKKKKRKKNVTHIFVRNNNGNKRIPFRLIDSSIIFDFALDLYCKKKKKKKTFKII